MINLDRFSFPLSQEYASRECPYCGDYPCSCYVVERQEEMDEFVDESWSRGMFE